MIIADWIWLSIARIKRSRRAFGRVSSLRGLQTDGVHQTAVATYNPIRNHSVWNDWLNDRSAVKDGSVPSVSVVWRCLEQQLCRSKVLRRIKLYMRQTIRKWYTRSTRSNCIAYMQNICVGHTCSIMTHTHVNTESEVLFEVSSNAVKEVGSAPLICHRSINCARLLTTNFSTGSVQTLVIFYILYCRHLPSLRWITIWDPELTT